MAKTKTLDQLRAEQAQHKLQRLEQRKQHYEKGERKKRPTVHEGATVQAMEKKGMRTEKGEFNRFISFS